MNDELIARWRNRSDLPRTYAELFALSAKKSALRAQANREGEG